MGISVLLGSMSLGTWMDKVFAKFDMSIFRLIASLQCKFLNEVSVFFTAFGDEIFLIAIFVLGLIFICFKRTRKFGFALALSIAISFFLTNCVFKILFQRIRPYNTLQQNTDYFNWYLNAGGLTESDYCFPSGHSASAVGLGFTLFLVLLHERKYWLSIVPFFICMMVSFSRIYLMVHYPSDVLFGVLIGMLSSIPAFLVVLKVEKLQKNKTPDISRTRKALPNHIMALLVSGTVVLFFALSLYSLIDEIQSDPLRCAYHDEYDCQNRAQTDNKMYPPIDGKYYCKIHWRSISNQSSK